MAVGIIDCTIKDPRKIQMGIASPVNVDGQFVSFSFFIRE
jgi:hypothetical protein